MALSGMHEDFAEGVVSAYDPPTREHTRRAELDSTQIPVYVRARYYGEAADLGRNDNSARGYNGSRQRLCAVNTTARE